jgi:hypothetical protein
MRGDRADAERRLDEDPTLVEDLTDDEREALVEAAEHGNGEAVALMLDLGFPLDARRKADGAAALHAAAFSGAADTVELLLDRGADVDARDSFWNSTALRWAAVGSGEQPAYVPAPDWPGTVRILLDRGARVDEVPLDAGDPKAPSHEVAALLRARL